MKESNENILKSLIEEIRSENVFKIKLVLTLYRTSNYLANRNRLVVAISVPIFVLYIFISEWLLGIEIPIKTRIGKGLKIYHGVGLVVHGKATIGDNCILRHGVTIGNKINSDGSLTTPPRIGNNVEFGANSTALGSINIGNNAIIGANSVVTKDVLDNAVVAGIPAKKIGERP